MKAGMTIEIVGCHAEGEVGDVIIGGVEPPPGETIWEQAQWIVKDQTLRNFVLNEPRGGVFRHVNLLVPAKDPQAVTGWIITEPEDTPPMSGSNSIGVSTVLLETGIVTMREPETRFKLEAPGGLVDVTAECRDDTFVIVDAQSVGFEIRPDEARAICETGIKIAAAANEQLGFTHPGNAGISQISFCQFTNPVF